MKLYNGFNVYNFKKIHGDREEERRQQYPLVQDEDESSN